MRNLPALPHPVASSHAGRPGAMTPPGANEHSRSSGRSSGSRCQRQLGPARRRQLHGGGASRLSPVRLSAPIGKRQSGADLPPSSRRLRYRVDPGSAARVAVGGLAAYTFAQSRACRCPDRTIAFSVPPARGGRSPWRHSDRADTGPRTPRLALEFTQKEAPVPTRRHARNRREGNQHLWRPTDSSPNSGRRRETAARAEAVVAAHAS